MATGKRNFNEYALSDYSQQRYIAYISENSQERVLIKKENVVGVQPLKKQLQAREEQSFQTTIEDSYDFNIDPSTPYEHGSPPPIDIDYDLTQEMSNLILEERVENPPKIQTEAGQQKPTTTTIEEEFEPPSRWALAPASLRE